MRLLASLAAVTIAAVGLQAPAAPAQAADMDCGDFSSQRAAQLFFLSHSPGSDPHRLDADGDGVVCESNPGPTYYGSDPTPGGGDTSTPATPPQPREVTRVVKVLNGELVKVRRGSRRAYVVHLMGTTVPRTTCEAKAARNDLRSWVRPGMVVRVLTDRKAPRRDGAGNLWRYLVRVKGDYDIGGSQIATGYAQVERKIRFSSKKRYLRWEGTAERTGEGYHGTC